MKFAVIFICSSYRSLNNYNTSSQMQTTIAGMLVTALFCLNAMFDVGSQSLVLSLIILRRNKCVFISDELKERN